MRPIDADSLKPDMIHEYNTFPAAPQYGTLQRVLGVSMEQIAKAPTIEPNLILPERMERGDIYEVGETIVVMNHDDYYDLLCKSWVPKRGEWIDDGGIERCNQCGERKEFPHWNFCPVCGARMKGADDADITDQEEVV